MAADEIVLQQADGSELVQVARRLFREYAIAIGTDLEYQGFSAELAALPAPYVPPRGALLIAHAGTDVAGCAALRSLDSRTGEMKRLYVCPSHRSSGLGRRLVEAVIGVACQAGYSELRLDTLPTMTAAQALYRRLGFVEIPPYGRAYVPGTRFYALLSWTPDGAGRALPWFLLLYCGASLLHFVHNAEYLADYPDLPHWISRASIYVAWAVIFTIGLSGYVLFRRNRTALGLVLLAIYTALGLDGLLHYGRAPISAHTFGMNLTIWTEVAAAAAALAVVLSLAARRLLPRSDEDQPMPEGTVMQKSGILPPVYFLGALALAVALHYAIPLAQIVPRPWHLIGAVLIVIGLVFIVLPARTFKARDTAIKPFETSSVLVQDGFFSVSRNPMYLGMVFVALGVATLLGSATPFLVPVILAVVLQTRFIRHEEQGLEGTFGNDYRSYKARVRRWL